MLIEKCLENKWVNRTNDKNQRKKQIQTKHKNRQNIQLCIQRQANLIDDVRRIFLSSMKLYHFQSVKNNSSFSISPQTVVRVIIYKFPLTLLVVLYSIHKTIVEKLPGNHYSFKISHWTYWNQCVDGNKGIRDCNWSQIFQCDVVELALYLY